MNTLYAAAMILGLAVMGAAVIYILSTTLGAYLACPAPC